MTQLRLLADIGGTNARFALCPAHAGQRPEEIDPTALAEAYLPAAAYAGFLDALQAALAVFAEQSFSATDIKEVAIAAAGPVVGHAIPLTNLPWTIDALEVSKMLDGAKVGLFNDLEAVALSLPYLAMDDIENLRGPDTSIGFKDTPRAMIAINVGTGFGAAATVRGATGWVALGAEPGHMSFAPATPAEAALSPQPASVEELLSGPALARLPNRMGEAGNFDGATIFTNSEINPVFSACLTLFSDALGRISGDLALATGAWDGVFLCGGVVEGWKKVADLDAFIARFEDKAAMTERMTHIPVMHITRPAPAMLGLAHAEISRARAKAGL